MRSRQSSSSPTNQSSTDRFVPVPSHLRQVAAASVLCLLAAAFSGAQALERVQGMVRGGANEPLPSITVTFENTVTHQQGVAHTDDSGSFALSGLPPGRYSVTAEGAGMRSLQHDFILQPGWAAGANVTIRLAAGSSKPGSSIPGEFQVRPASLKSAQKAASGAHSANPIVATPRASITNSPATFSIYSPVLSPSPIGFGFSVSNPGGLFQNGGADSGGSTFDARLPLAATEDGTDTTFVATDANNAIGTDFYDSVVTGYFVGATAHTYRFQNNAWTLLRTDTITGYTSVPGSDAAADHTITFADSGPATRTGDVVWISLDNQLGQMPLDDVAYRGSQYPTYCLDYQTLVFSNTGGCFPLNPTAPSPYNVPYPYTIVADVPQASDIAAFGPSSQYVNASSLQVTDSNTERQGLQSYVGFYQCGSGDEQYQPGHTYELGVWLKGTTTDGKVTIGYTQFPGNFFGNTGIGTTFTGVKNTWQYYTWDFPAPGCVQPGAPVVAFELNYNAPGTLETNGLHVIDKAYPAVSDAAPLLPAVQQAFNEYLPSTIRIWSGFADSAGGYQYWSLDSWLLPEWQGRTSPEIGNFYATDVTALHLPAALAATKQAGANPWLICQMAYSPQEWSNLVDYLAAPAGTPGYASKRPADHPGPYTDDFSTIYLEVGNEEWGTQETPVNFAYGQWVHFVATAATTGKSYATQAQLLGKFKFVTNSFFLEPSFGSAAIAQAPESTIVDYALYNSGDTSLTGSAYYQSDLVQLPVTNKALIDAMVSQQQSDAANGHPYALAAYESGPGADTPAHQGDPTLAAATATMDVDLYAQLRGFNPVNFFLFGEGTGPYTSHTNFAGGFLPHPVWEASQMRNQFLHGDMVWVVPGNNQPTVVAPDNGDSYPAIGVYAFRETNNQVDIAIVSRDFYNTTPVTLNFPGTPVGTANLYSLTPPPGGDASATNDSGLAVPINSQTLSGVTQTYTLNVAPGSFTILQVPITGSWSTSIPAPAAPTGLTAHANNGSVQLGWSTVDGAASYNVKRGLKTGGPYTAIGVATGPAYSDTSVINGTQYFYVVTAVNVGGESSPSNEASATPNVAIAGILTSQPPLDGSDTGAWTETPSYPLLHDFNTHTPDTGSYKVLWDSHYLYVLATVQDSTPVAPTEANVFSGDSVEVYFSGTDTKSTSYGPTDFQYAFPYGNGGAVPTESHHNAVEGVIEGQQSIPGGYQLAIAIPWTTLGTTPLAGHQYGFDVMVNDATSQGARIGKLAWWGTVDETWNNPSLMGPLVLSSSGNVPASTTTLEITPRGDLTFGEPVTLSASVAPKTGSATPTGTVTFNIAGKQNESETLELNSAGTASYTTTAPLAGVYSVTATYHGSKTLASSTSAAQPLVVAGVPTTTELTISPNSNLTYQEIWTLKATVTSNDGAIPAEGTVTFVFGAAEQTIAVNENGIATYSGPIPTIGTFLVQAIYNGTGIFAPSFSADKLVTVASQRTVTKLTVNPTSGLEAGAPITLTAKVAAAVSSGIPQGAVTFEIAGPNPVIQTVSVDKTGAATYTGVAPADGHYSITATYNGSPDYAPSVSAVTAITVTGAVTPTTTALAQSPTTNLIVGTPWRLTAVVAPDSGSVTPTGSVTFVWSGGAATVNLDAAGTAVYQGTVPPVGSQYVRATYNGSPAFGPSTSATIGFVSLAVPTTTTLTVSPSGSVVTGQPLKLIAVVAANLGTAVPAGSVTFTIGSATESVALDSTGTATYTTTAPAPGVLAITASYGGSSTLAKSTSHTVNESVKTIPTKTALTVSPDSGIVTGQAWTLTAVVTSTVGSAIPAGSVTFNIGTTTEVIALDSTGKAVYNGNAPGAGSYTITANFGGSTDFAASASSAVNEKIAGAPTSTTLQVAPALTLAAGQPYTLMATVSAQTGATAPQGTVNFTVGSASYSATLNASGVATYSGAAPGAGTYAVSAAYSGSTEFAGSSSNPVNITVVAAGTAIPIAIPNYSFEQGGVGYNVPTNWTFTSSSTVSADYALQQIVGGPNANPPAADGSDYWAPSDFNQSTLPYGVTTATLTTGASVGVFQANTEYTLTVALADPADGTPASEKSIGFQLLANGVPVQTFAATSIPSGGNFQDYSLNFYTSSNASIVRQNITIALVYTYSGQYNRQAFFDNVRLTQTYGVSQPLTNTTTTLSIVPNSSSLVEGTPYTLTAVVAPSTGSTTPAGSVVFTIGSSTQTVSLDQTGTATYNGTVPSSAGALQITAAYQGSSVFNGSNSNVLNETVVAPGSPIPIAIPNYSFELGGAGYNVPTDWTFTSSGTSGGYAIQYIANSTNPPAEDGSDYWAPGDFDNGSQPYGSSTATLTTSNLVGTFQANTTYALTVALAIPVDFDSSYKQVGFQLLANGVVVASLPAAALTEGANFKDFTLTFDTATNSAVVGQNITIALVYVYDGPYNRNAYFDNIRLTAAADQ